MSAIAVSAQQSEIYSNESVEFNRALSLYKNSQYQSAQILFDRVAAETRNQEVKADCAYYAANCAIRLEQPDADDRMEQFVADYPTSSKQNQAFIEVAHYYFEQGRYPQALEWFDKVDESSLSARERDKFNFQKGYAFFSAKNKKQATDYFNRVVNSPEYGSQAKYYLGFMSYEADDYKEASKYFDEVSGEEKYKEKLSYFEADMNFKLGKFKEAIASGEKAMAKSNAIEKSELNKIIGESYFNLKEYDKAIPYLNQYKGKKGKWSNTDYYQLGYAYYKQGDFTNAISQFNKIVGGNDFVAQNAYYHLGESYLKLNQKQQALNAFKNASEMQFDAAIQEDAALNYAKLSYDIGNSYQPVPDVLAGFVSRYPNSPARAEIEGLLIDSYISSKNYAGALALLEKNKSANREAYQKVTFFRGLELYTDGNYREALSMFKKSVGEPRNTRMTARATFWKAESEFTLEDYREALVDFKDFAASADAKATPEYGNINYNIAYTHFKLKEYDQAGDFFQKYIDTKPSDKVRVNDAYLRLGDSRFVTAKYWPAMEAYNKAIELKAVDADYAAFQKGISYGFVARNDRKIEDLTKFAQQFPKSAYRDDALFELANTYVAEKNTDKAVATYDQLLKDYPTGTYASKAVLRQGLVYYNAGKDQQALGKFKKVASDYPRTPEAVEAVSTARLIYVDNGNVDQYAAWVKTLDFVEVSDADLDNDTFAAAEKPYRENNTKGAISGFSTYLRNFPNGLHALKANFYLAQSYYADGQKDKSVPHYEAVTSGVRNEYMEQSLVRLAEIYIAKKDETKIIPTLKRLEADADYPQNVTFAQANLMKTYYEIKDYDNAVAYAEKVAAQPKMDDKVKSDAQIVIARSAWHTGNEAKARAAYEKVLTSASGEVAAEALYYDAYFKNKDGKYEQSNASVQKLTKNYSGYKYFGAKGLVVMARNFYALKDSFQATYILESVIKNFKNYTDVIEEAQTELDRIKAEEAKTNSSIGN
jgi:TolA-binding protein